MSTKEDIETLRAELIRIVLDDYDRNVRPNLKRRYTLPDEPAKMGVPVRVPAKPTRPKH
jgi:hypothetical protein